MRLVQVTGVTLASNFFQFLLHISKIAIPLLPRFTLTTEVEKSNARIMVGLWRIEAGHRSRTVASKKVER